MRKIIPYRTVNGAKAALDNGGRIYNLLTRPKDNRITHGEIAKAAGVWFDTARAMLFLHMAFVELNEEQRRDVLALLDRPMVGQYNAHAPRRLSPSAISAEGKVGELVVVKGLPKFAGEAVHRLKIMVGDGENHLRTRTISVHYDLYRLCSQGKGEAGKTLPALAIRWKSGSRRLKQIMVRLGGIIRAIQLEGKLVNKEGIYLEPWYFTSLDGGGAAARRKRDGSH